MNSNAFMMFRFPLQRFTKPSENMTSLICKKPHYRKKTRRYSRPVPGDQVQLDVCKIANGKYQRTDLDDCSRYLIVSLFTRRTAAASVIFLEQVLEEIPFPIQRIQTDRGREFFAEKLQRQLIEWWVKSRMTSSIYGCKN